MSPARGCRQIPKERQVSFALIVGVLLSARGVSGVAVKLFRHVGFGRAPAILTELEPGPRLLSAFLHKPAQAW